MTLPVSIVARPTLQISHHRIHEGNHFAVHRISKGINPPPALSKYFLIIPPPVDPIPSNTVEIHFLFEVFSNEAGITVEFFEGPIISANGTPLFVRNNNRNSTTTALTLVFEDPTVVLEGTSIFEEIGGNATTGGLVGEDIRDEDEIILQIGTPYLLKITPIAKTDCTTELNWYDQRPSSPVPLGIGI